MSKKEAKTWPKWPVQIDHKGRIAFRNPADWEAFKVPFYGQEMDIILKKRVKDRSRQEERYYYGVVVPYVAEAMGVSREAAHDFMAELFLKVEEKTTSGIRYERVMSTTELGDARYDQYVFKECVPWAARPTDEDTGLTQESGLSLWIPLPNECDYENL